MRKEIKAVEKGTEEPEVYKFPLPDGRTAELSSEMNSEEMMSAVQEFINMYYPSISVLEPKEELLALAKRSLYRMAILCDQLDRESGRGAEPAEDDIETRKRTQQIADAAVLACCTIMKLVRHRFILAHCPEDCPEGIAIQTNPGISDPNWNEYFEAMGRRLQLMDHDQWHHN